MATSVKIDESAKDRLEELQAEIRLETGRSVTQQELLGRIIREHYESSEALVDSFRNDWEGLSEAEIDQWLSGTTDAGEPLDSDGIDRIVYEEERLDEPGEET